MSHPLIDRLVTEFGWSRLADTATLDDYLSRAGTHMIFVPGDVSRNLETPDVAVIAPELSAAFQGRFDCALAEEEADRDIRERAKTYKTPSLLFFRDGALIGAIPKVRDWSDYVGRITHILAQPVAAE